VSGLALAVGMVPALAGAGPAPRAAAATGAAAAPADDLTASSDSFRDGWDQSEDPNLIGPSAVPSFVQRFSHVVNGQVYAQPLVASGKLIVTTENDNVYGLDPSTGNQIWTDHLGSPFVMTSVKALRKCGDLTPYIGITGTPAYYNGNIYVFANVLVARKPQYYLFGIRVSDGAIVQKTLISGHPTNDKLLTFSAQQQMERPGVLVTGGYAYAAFASHCDFRPYTGYVVRVTLSGTHAVDLWTDESGNTYNRGGIWQGAGGVLSDTVGRIFVTSGNGISPAIGAGGHPPGQLSESVIRLGLTHQVMAAKDFFSPADAPQLDAADSDFGSGGPVELPFGTTSGTTSYPHLLLQGGKEGRLFVLNLDNLGGRTASNSGALFFTNAYGGQYGHPAAFGDTTTLNPSTQDFSNDFVFSAGKNDPLRVFRVLASGSGTPILSEVGNTSLTYPFSSGSPVVTSDSNHDASSVVVWEIRSSGSAGTIGELDAYSLGSLISSNGQASTCTSSSTCTLTPIWHASLGTVAKFSTPATSNGWVYVGTRDGHVIGYAAQTTNAPVVSAAAALPPTGVSTTTSRLVSITARNTVTFTQVSARTGSSNALVTTPQYTVGQLTETKKGSTAAHPVTLPVTLAKGDKLHAQVTFAPAAPGPATGALTFTTSTGRIRVVPLTGTGIKPGLYATPGSVAFPLAADQGVIDVPVGISAFEQVDIINGGTTTETIKSISRPAGPFKATGVPAIGTKITPGQSFVVQLIFSPTQPGPASARFRIAVSHGKRVTVPLSGIGAPSVSKVTASQSTISFGSVPVGTTATQNIHITNDGNIPSTVTVPVAPKAPFHSLYHVAKGLPFNPQYDLLIPVTFTPTTKGTFSAPYRLVWTDRLGTHSLTVMLTGTGA
jgi:Tfp pilus assembly protein FimT